MSAQEPEARQQLGPEARQQLVAELAIRLMADSKRKKTASFCVTKARQVVALVFNEAQEVPGTLTLAGKTMADLERAAIAATLEHTDGNRKQAATLLDIGERTIYRKIEKYGLCL